MHLYAYRYIDVDGPTWGPLERIVERTARKNVLPTLDADDFAYGGHLVSLDGRPDLHLYKHGITRCYLNVDDKLALYGFIDGDHDLDIPRLERTVYYCRHRDLAVALDYLSLERCRNAVGSGGSLPDNVVALAPRRARNDWPAT